MAFTLLGTGTEVTKNINPKSDNTIVASAACKHSGYRYVVHGQWKVSASANDPLAALDILINGVPYVRTESVKCGRCGGVVYTYNEYKRV